jgi:predicted nucleic acid-binding protein
LAELAIVDTGALYAAADSDDRDHRACVEALAREDLDPVIPALCVTEDAYLVRTRLGNRAEAAFVRGVGHYSVEAPEPSEWERIAGLIETYADLPLGCVDASLVSLCERLGAKTVIGLDNDLRVVRPAHTGSLRLIP